MGINSMCYYDLNEYNPFEPLILYEYGCYEDYVDSEPMEDYNWEEWLEADG